MTRPTCRFLLALALLVAPGALVAVAGPAAAQVPPDDPGRGLVYRDLRRGRPDGPCRGMFESDTPRRGMPARTSCVHGPDPAPPGVDVRTPAEPLPAQPAEAAAAAPFPCVGNGADGYRVQVVYARASDKPDRYAEYASSFVQWAANVDAVLDASAAETGASQHVRWVTDPACNLVVQRVTLTSGGDDSLDATIDDLFPLGYDRTDRKYLLFVDADVYCGIGEVWPDDSASAVPGSNKNNGNSQTPGLFARVDAGCWSQGTPAHEVMHTLGGVQLSAPHSTGGWHCTDESDRMCYDDDNAGPVTTQQVCPSSHEQRYDCNHDDYYHTSPSPGSYLATHWNTARSAFLTPAVPFGSPAGAVSDYDGNGTSDMAVWRPSTGTWFVRNGTSALWGTSGDIPVPGDYDGNGTTDMAVWRPSTGTWFVRNGAAAVWGTSGDIPVPGDYDGNGTSDMAVWRPSTGTWFVRNASGATFGTSGDIPVPGDYDGNGTSDMAVWRPSTGTWFVRNGTSALWGTSGDIPVPGDYDGNGTTDMAVWRPSGGTWFVRNGAAAAWGTSGDIPVPGDYDGNGTTDMAVWRPSGGTWFVRNGAGATFGASGDVPLTLPSAIRQFFF